MCRSFSWRCWNSQQNDMTTFDLLKNAVTALFFTKNLEGGDTLATLKNDTEKLKKAVEAHAVTGRRMQVKNKKNCLSCYSRRRYFNTHQQVVIWQHMRYAKIISMCRNLVMIVLSQPKHSKHYNGKLRQQKQCQLCGSKVRCSCSKRKTGRIRSDAKRVELACRTPRSTQQQNFTCSICRKERESRQRRTWWNNLEVLGWNKREIRRYFSY